MRNMRPGILSSALQEFIKHNINDIDFQLEDDDYVYATSGMESLLSMLIDSRLDLQQGISIIGRASGNRIITF